MYFFFLYTSVIRGGWLNKMVSGSCKINEYRAWEVMELCFIWIMFPYIGIWILHWTELDNLIKVIYTLGILNGFRWFLIIILGEIYNFNNLGRKLRTNNAFPPRILVNFIVSNISFITYAPGFSSIEETKRFRHPLPPIPNPKGNWLNLGGAQCDIK